jgi:hypothetical protein
MRTAIALIILLVLAAPAQAARGERAEARAFIEVSERLRSSLPADRERAGATLLYLYKDSECAPALEGVPGGKASTELFESTLVYAYLVALHPLREQLATFAADLQRVDVRSRVLRSGRSRLRRQVRLIQQLPAPAGDYCAQVEAWRRAGYPAGGAPTLHHDPAWEQLDSGYRTDRRRISRAGRLLRRHGAPRRIARMWGGHLNSPVE